METVRHSALRRLLLFVTIALAQIAPGTAQEPIARSARPCRVVNETQGRHFPPDRGDSLAEAIASADPGDQLEITGICTGAYTVDRNIVLTGVPTQQFPVPTLDGGQTTAPPNVDPNLLVTTLTVETGVATTLANLTITGGTGEPAPFGAFSIGGGGILNSGDLTIISCVVTGNRALYNGSGGGILNTGSVVVQGASVVSANRAGNEGGGIANLGGRVTVTESSMVIENRAGDFGGGIVNVAGTLTIDASTISGNRTNFGGGAIYNYFAAATVIVQNSSTVSDNIAVDVAGGILNLGTLTVNSSTVSGNRASNGGGLYNSGGVAALNSTTVTGNRSTFGGGIYNASGSVTLQSSLVTQNTALVAGGGIYNNATVILISSVVTANDPDNCFSVPGC